MGGGGHRFYLGGFYKRGITVLKQIRINCDFDKKMIEIMKQLFCLGFEEGGIFGGFSIREDVHGGGGGGACL